MALRKIIDFIPDIYRSFLPEVFKTEIPPEPFSDCHNCPMTSSTREEMDNDLSKPYVH